MNLNNLEVGQFAERNKSVIYRYRNTIPIITTLWLFEKNGLFIVERSPEVPIWQDTPKDNIDNAMVTSSKRDTSTCNIFYIEKPKKKHVDNAIKMLKDALKDKNIDNLTYIENLNILRNYLKTVIVSEEK
jgi:hypothetical protein